MSSQNDFDFESLCYVSRYYQEQKKKKKKITRNTHTLRSVFVQLYQIL